MPDLEVTKRSHLICAESSKNRVGQKKRQASGALSKTVGEWLEWKNSTSLIDSEIWIAHGFTSTTAAPWIEHNVPPSAAKVIQKEITPSEASEWIKAVVHYSVLFEWRKLVPCASEAAVFLAEGFTLTEASGWFDLKILASEAPSFQSIG
ncbi:hypothetical protein DSO57_1028645 [Entomophthora muscae]|uniref:Uncharacterized protein n=1 Tax=Entomophthora muscae TaxID=34485 RepID=A0ACC2ULJ1_9FUNG|nr:hypothetical protein DSO57_1028645 [Entomophthora muscae]